MTIDELGNIYLVGTTKSKDYPVRVFDTTYAGGEGECFVTKLSINPMNNTYELKIDHPENVTYVYGTTGHFIEWHPEDPNPCMYEVTRDETLIKWGIWNSSEETIAVNIDGLDVGEYDFTLKVNNTDGFSLRDVVVVHVITQQTTTLNTSDNFGTFQTIQIFVTMGAVGVIFMIMCLSFRKRKY